MKKQRLVLTMTWAVTNPKNKMLEQLRREALQASFINDSTQLRYTPDTLDQVDPGVNDNMLNQKLDNKREHVLQFATPMLNHRMRQRKENSQWSSTPQSAPDSEKGLGNMHFICIVLEHHRNGGSAEDIEELYKQVHDDEEVVQKAPPPPQALAEYVPSDSDDDDTDI
jgi:hypothetical protein